MLRLRNVFITVTNEFIYCLIAASNKNNPISFPLNCSDREIKYKILQQWSRLYLRIGAPLQRPNFLETLSNVRKSSWIHPFLHFLISTCRVFEITCPIPRIQRLQLPLLTLGYASQTLFALSYFSQFQQQNLSDHCVTNGYIKIFQIKAFF